MKGSRGKRLRSGKLLFITGLSGSGKTLAMKAFEDLGFFCVDNLPAKLIGPFAELTAQGGRQIDRVALAVDIRERGFLRDFPGVLDRLKERKFHPQVVFLEAREDVLVRRFSETRRPHPLGSRGGSLLQALRSEKRKLARIRKVADQILDTSEMTVHELRRHVLERFSEGKGRRGLALNLVSFGYKNGLPVDADLVFDVRFLPNPFFEPKLRHRTGNDSAVERYVLAAPATPEFLTRLASFVGFLIPQYVSEGKSYLTLAVGCTGGRHRSVVVTNLLARELRKKGEDVRVTHRDVERE